MQALMSTAELAALIDAGTPRLRLFDVTTHLRTGADGSWSVESARADHAAAHIPGAAFLDLQQQLSDHGSPLRFTRLPDAALAAALGAAGIGDGDDVVLYSSTNAMWATRVWWMLRALGHPARVLDGGLPKWRAEGRPLASGPQAYAPARLSVRTQPGLWADRDEVLRSIGDGAVCTINALTAPLHSGERKAGYARAGHISGSVNLPYPELTAADGALRPPSELRERVDALGNLTHRRVICYCGGGIAATLTALVLTELGHDDVAVYDGSLSEWAADPSLPMSTLPSADQAAPASSD
ncbi:MAG: rhodanese-like domain-containing protein [Rubrivivax sp.]